MTKTEQFESIENLGAIWSANSDREHTSFSL
jgi:predicted Zn-dependent peptidase